MSEAKQKVGRWYFGGLASAGAACCTHPLDLLKVHLQTTAGKEKLGIISQAVKVVRGDGVLALYNGLSASLVRQLTYSTTRFAIYEVSPLTHTHTLHSVSGSCIHRFFTLTSLNPQWCRRRRIDLFLGCGRPPQLFSHRRGKKCNVLLRGIWDTAAEVVVFWWQIGFCSN